MIVISGSDFTSPSGQFQHRTRDAARDPQAEDKGQRQTKQGKAEVSGLEPKIGRGLLIERALQEHERVSVLGGMRASLPVRSWSVDGQIMLRRRGGVRLA